MSINGPFYNNPSKGTWILEVPIIILINTFTNDQDIYKVKRQQGFFVKRYTSAINVFKYGTPGDDSYLGCLVLKTEINTQILEQISTNMRLIQSVLSAIYEIELSG